MLVMWLNKEFQAFHGCVKGLCMARVMRLYFWNRVNIKDTALIRLGHVVSWFLLQEIKYINLTLICYWFILIESNWKS